MSLCNRSVHFCVNVKVDMKHLTVCSVFSFAVMIINVKLNKFLFEEAEDTYPCLAWVQKSRCRQWRKQ